MLNDLVRRLKEMDRETQEEVLRELERRLRDAKDEAK